MIFKNKKFLAGVVSLLFFFVLFLPVLTQAADARLVQCGNSDSSGVIANPCDFTDFVGLINRIIYWVISIAGVIFTISFIYGGFLYITSGVKPGNKEKAINLLWNTLLGFVIILISWLIVYTIINVLVDDSQKTLILKFIK
jgi:hypothetical protein